MIAFPLDDAWLKGPLHVGLIGKRSAILWAVLEGVNLSYMNQSGQDVLSLFPWEPHRISESHKPL